MGRELWGARCGTWGWGSEVREMRCGVRGAGGKVWEGAV